MKKFFSVLFLFSLISCEHRKIDHGRCIYQEDLKLVKVNETTMLEVMKILGTPSLELDDGSWLYASSSGYESLSANFIGDKKFVKFIFKDSILREIKEVKIGQQIYKKAMSQAKLKCDPKGGCLFR